MSDHVSPESFQIGWFDLDENNSSVLTNRLAADASQVAGEHDFGPA